MQVNTTACPGAVHSQTRNLLSYADIRLKDIKNAIRKCMKCCLHNIAEAFFMYNLKSTAKSIKMEDKDIQIVIFSSDICSITKK